MEADVRWCPHCQRTGEKKRLRPLQINDSLAVLLCENEKCVQLGQTSSLSTVILQRKASDIPNTKKKKSKSVPASNATPKTLNLSPPNASGPFLNADDAKSSLNKQACGTSVDSMPNNPSTDLPAGILSSTAMPRVILWANKSVLCWLDACMCVLIACRSLRACLANLHAKSSVKTLCTAFVEAQRTRTMKAGKTQGCSQISEARVMPAVKLAGETNADDVQNSPDITEPARSELDSPNSKLNTEVCQTDGATTLLDKARDEIYRRLQPMLKCQAGEEDSPVMALPSLLRLDGSIEEHFMCRYRWEFCCSVCGHTQVNGARKTMPTFTSVPADFSMEDPVMLHSCYKCHSPHQKSRLVFYNLSACVMMHFRDGLPDSDLSKHHTFNFSRDTYTLAAVVRYRRNPNHFVTVVRDPETNHWLEYDDLKPSPYTWQAQASPIPAREIHILVWERQKSPCTACVQMHSDVMSILDAPVQTPASAVPVGVADAAPQPSTSVRWNGNGIFRKSRLTVSSAFQGKTLQGQNAVKRNDNGRRSAGLIEVDKEPSGVIAVDRSTDQFRIDFDLRTEMESTPTVDPRPEVPQESKRESVSNANPKSLSKSCTKETSKLPRLNQKDTEMSPRNVRTEPLQDSKKVRTQNIKSDIKTDVPNPTFLGNLASRRKSNKVKDSASTTSEILAKIPNQLLSFSQQSSALSYPGIGSALATREGTSRNASILNKIPKQLVSASASLRAPQLSQSELSNRAARPILVGSLRRVLVKQVKFQPYGQSLERKTQEATKKILPVPQRIPNNGSTLTSWQKRVGKYSSAVDVPRKRVRRDSFEDTGSTCSDVPKHLGPPCSSVSSPSACSDISSVSDNQSFTSGKDDLCNTLDELCKVLDIGSYHTPSVSSRLSSPSRDMFFSELFAEGTLPSVGTDLPALTPVNCTAPSVEAQSQSAMSPSCVTMLPTGDPVTRQQDTYRPMQQVDSSVGHVTSHSDHMITASNFNNAAQTIDDLTDTGLPEDIQESLDVLGSEWNEDLFELLGQ